MEHAAFEPPLSDEQLKELGRLVINFGFVEFLVGLHVSMLLEIPFAARRVLVHPLPTRRKTDILRERLTKIPGEETRGLVEEACKLIDPSIRERNILLHGIWGFDGPEPHGKPVVAPTKETRSQRRPEDVTKYADIFAIASRKLKHAITVDSGQTAVEEAERLVIVP